MNTSSFNSTETNGKPFFFPEEIIPFVLDPKDVRAGVVYDANNLPDPKDVRAGTIYG